MRRREFVTLTVGAAATWPLAARAQQAGKLPTMGFLGADPTAFTPWTNAFVSRLRELGWIENRTVAIEYRWSEGRAERYAEIAAEFVRMNVDVIVTVGSAVPTVRQATTVIPIVFAVGVDPVRSGLVASLAKPGGNVTGLSLQAANLAGKRIELLREAVPQLRRLGIIFNVGNAQPVLEMEDTKAAAEMLGLDVVPLEIRQGADIVPIFDTVNGKWMHRRHRSAYGRQFGAHPHARARCALADSLQHSRFCAVRRFHVLWTELLGAVPALGRLCRQNLARNEAGRHTVEQPTKFELVVNLTTAKALGLNIPQRFVLRADEVIE